MSSPGRQSLLVTANSVLGAIQGLVALFLIARYMGDAVLGSRAFALAIVSLVGIAARLGLPTTHVRELARGVPPGPAVGAYLQIKGAITLAFMLAAGAAAWLWFDVLGKGVTDTTPTALLLAYWIVVAQSLRDIPVNTFQGLRRILEREAVLLSNTLVTVLLTAAVAITYADSHGRWSPFPIFGHGLAGLFRVREPLTQEQGIDLLMGGFLAGEIAALALAVVLFVRLRIPVERPAPGLRAHYLLWTLPIMLLAVGEVATKWLSQVILGFWWDASELGQFAAAGKLSEAFLLLGASVAIILLPALSTLHARSDHDAARNLVRSAERWMSLLMWPGIALVALAAQPLVHVLLSDRFTRAGPLLVVLGLQGLVASLLMPVQQLALGMGQPRHAARVVLVSVAIDVGLNLVLIPRHVGPVPAAGLGAMGAALAALAATGAALALYLFPGRGWPGHALPVRALLKHAAAAAATYLLLRLVGPAAPDRFLPLLGYAAVVGAVYVLALVALRELRRGDWRDLRSMWRAP